MRQKRGGIDAARVVGVVARDSQVELNGPIPGISTSLSTAPTVSNAIINFCASVVLYLGILQSTYLLPTHSLTKSATQALTFLRTHSRTYKLTPSTHALTFPGTHSRTRTITHPRVLSLTHALSRNNKTTQELLHDMNINTNFLCEILFRKSYHSVKHTLFSSKTLKRWRYSIKPVSATRRSRDQAEQRKDKNR